VGAEQHLAVPYGGVGADRARTLAPGGGACAGTVTGCVGERRRGGAEKQGSRRDEAEKQSGRREEQVERKKGVRGGRGGVGGGAR